MILKEISALIKYQIPKDEIAATFRRLEVEGRIGKKEIIQLLVILIQKEVEREQSEKSE